MITLLITIYLACLVTYLICILNKNRKESIKDMYRCKGHYDNSYGMAYAVNDYSTVRISMTMIQARGFMAMQDFRQLAESGINVCTELSEYYTKLRGKKVTVQEEIKLLLAEKITDNEVKLAIRCFEERTGLKVI